MANISQEDVEHVSHLARIEINEKEKSKLTEDLGEILNYVAELNEADTQSIEPVSQISGLANMARSDEVTNPSEREKLLVNAPEQKDGFIKVKKVFE